MNRARPITVTKVRQVHAEAPKLRPGRPINGPNYVAQRAPSAKKTAVRKVRSRKTTIKA
ncbi:MAG: hypothetical protein HKN91_06295 [Acidimicrobiia bacterium]|nr:hypothetical protein [Acidimicrobiia bacterium]